MASYKAIRASTRGTRRAQIRILHQILAANRRGVGQVFSGKTVLKNLHWMRRAGIAFFQGCMAQAGGVTP